MSQLEAQIVGLLASGEKYGLGLVKESAGEISRGSIYTTLQRMEEKGFVESRQEAVVEDHIGLPRRLYKATGLGKRVAREVELSRQRMALALAGGRP